MMLKNSKLNQNKSRRKIIKKRNKLSRKYAQYRKPIKLKFDT